LDFEGLLEEKYGFRLKPQQRDAVLNIDSPAILLAAPGSGKSTVLVLRCANMAMCCGIAPEKILTLTYDRFTKESLTKCFQGIFGREAQRGLRFTTIPDFCSLVMKEYAALTDSQPPKLMEEGKRRLLRSFYAKANDGEYLPDNRLEDLVRLVSLAKNGMTASEQTEKDLFGRSNLDEIIAAYEAYMHANNCADIDELQARVLAAFSEKPALLQLFQERYPYIHVDEAQELSKLQCALLERLTAPAGNIFLAGDEDQSLYATSRQENLRNFCRVYPQMKTLKMERNYRSTHAVVDAAGRLIKHNTARRMGTMNTGNEIGMPVEESVLADNSLLGPHVLAQLKGLPSPENSAVLYRNVFSAAVIMDALDREGIPFVLKDQKHSCFDHWVVQDILAFLALGHNQMDLASLKRIYRKLNTYIGKDAISHAAALMDNDASLPALDALLLGSKISDNATTRIKKLKEDIAALPSMPPSHTVQYILEKLEYGDYLKKTCGEGIYLESLLQITESIATIAVRTDSYLQLLERIRELTVLMEGARKSTEPNAVTLSSVHAAKGMEFRNVYIVDLYEGSFPTLAAISENNDGKKALMEEERRLFYVAVTRASKYVELIYAKKVNGNRVEPSRFIHELLPGQQAIKKARAGKAGRRSGTTAHKQTSSGKKAVRRPVAAAPAPQALPAFEQFHLEVGKQVQHQAFGQGIISAYDVKRDMVAIRFEKLGLKKFSASYCMSGGVLKKASGENSDNAVHFEQT
jgi:DNA helicase II / ATP-dependent DNA helicase PcrA